MAEVAFESSDYHRTLFQSLLDARTTNGSAHVVFEDVERKPLSYGKFTLACFVLGWAMARATKPGERVGVLLPNMVATAVTFFGLQAYARIPATLNFATGGGGAGR